MNPNTLIRYRRDLFVASRNPFAARWSSLRPMSLVQPALALPVVAAADDPEPDVDEDPEDDDDEFDEDDEADEDVDEDTEQTAEPQGQFPDAPDALKDAERPGAHQNRHGDRGGVS